MRPPPTRRPRTRLTRAAAPALVVAAAAAVPSPAAAQRAAARGAGGARFTLTSPDVAAGARVGERHVFNGFGCSGQNVSPALAWRNAPAGTRSYAVTVYDPDAPTGSGWWHWVVYNIPAGVTSLAAGAGSAGAGSAGAGSAGAGSAGAGGAGAAGADSGAARLPAGAVQGNTDYGAPGYGGPCPPPGDRPHRYVFTVHALKVERLDVPANATAALVGFNLNANRLASASLTARYGR